MYMSVENSYFHMEYFKSGKQISISIPKYVRNFIIIIYYYYYFAFPYKRLVN